MWLFLASFGRIQKNLSYLTDNFTKQGYKVLFLPYPSATTMSISYPDSFFNSQIVKPKIKRKSRFWLAGNSNHHLSSLKVQPIATVFPL